MMKTSNWNAKNLLILIGSGIGVLGVGLMVGKSVEAPNPAKRGIVEASAMEASNRAQIDASISEWQARVAGMDLKQGAGLFSEAMEIAESEIRRQVVALVAARWLAGDRRGFLDFLDEMEVVSTDEFRDWQKILPGLRDAVLLLDESLMKSALIGEMVAKMMAAQAEQDAPGAVSWIESRLTGDLRDQARAVVIGSLAATSPDQAKTLFAAMTQAGRRIEAAIAMGVALAEAHPQSAITWAGSLERPMERQLAMDAVLKEAAASDLEMAGKAWVDYSERLRAEMAERSKLYREEYVYLKALNPNSDDERTTPEAFEEERQDETERLLASSGSVIARQITAQDPQAAVSWVEKLPAGELRTQLWAAVLGKWAEIDPAGAWTKAATVDRLPIPATGAIFEAWGQSDARAAVRQVDEIRDPHRKEAAVAGLAAGWMTNPEVDSENVAEWAASLPSGKGRDEAMAVIVDSMVESSPDSAWNLALKIEGDAQQRDALSVVFASMLEVDLEAAREALAHHELSEASRKRLARMFKGATESGFAEN